jgi:uracil-DNA glycosylase family 4
MIPKAPYADCDHCPLRLYPCVRSSSPDLPIEEISLIIVGEAPGYYEVKEGRPFVGQSGQLLNAVLSHVGLDPASTYYTNAVLCQPPNNEISKYRAAIGACSARLWAELNKLPEVPIVALGNTALEALTGSSGILDARGKWHSTLAEVDNELPF